jgi:hypothetical protein
MATNPIRAQFATWNKDHQLLTRLLKKPQDHPRAVALFQKHHAAVHSASGNPDCTWSFQDQVLFRLTEREARIVPARCEHSLLWMVWHITRIEDVTMNILLADSPQVLHRGVWRAKLHAPTEDVGNAMERMDVERLSQAVDWKALLAYRRAVAKRTRTLVPRLGRLVLETKPPAERLARIVKEGAVDGHAEWLLRYWGGHPGANLLLMPASRHPMVHWNEAQRMMPRIARAVSAEGG